MIPTLSSGSIKEYLKSQEAANAPTAADIKETKISSSNIESIQIDILSELKAMTSLQEQLIAFLSKGKLDNLEEKREKGSEGGGGGGVMRGLLMLGAGAAMKGGGKDGSAGGFDGLGTALQLGGGLVAGTGAMGLIKRMLGVGKPGVPGATTGPMGRAVAATARAGAASKAFAGKLIKGGLTGAVVGILANPVGNAVEDLAGKAAGDLATAAMTGAAWGSLLGPTGMLVGAFAGLAIEGLQITTDWATTHRNEMADRLREDLAAETLKMNNANANLPEGEAPVITNDYMRSLGLVNNEAERTSQLFTNQNAPEVVAQEELLTAEIAIAKGILQAQGDDMDIDQARTVVAMENKQLQRQFMKASSEERAALEASVGAIMASNIQFLNTIPGVTDEHIENIISQNLNNGTLGNAATRFIYGEEFKGGTVAAVRAGAGTPTELQFGDEIVAARQMRVEAMEEQARIDRSIAGENEYWGKEFKGIEDSIEIIEALKLKQAELLALIPDNLRGSTSAIESATMIRESAQSSIGNSTGSAQPNVININNRSGSSRANVPPKTEVVVVPSPDTSVSTSDTNPAFKARRGSRSGV